MVRELNQLAHHWHCAAAQVTGWDEQEELFEHHKGKAKYAYNLIGKNRLPWYKIWEVTEGKTLADQWVNFQKAGKDPKYAAYLEEIREKMRQKVRESEQVATDHENMLKKHAELKRSAPQRSVNHGITRKRE